MSAVSTKAPADKDRVWWVVCAEYATGPFTRAGAQRKLEAIEEGEYCFMPHRIEARTAGLGRRW